MIVYRSRNRNRKHFVEFEPNYNNLIYEAKSMVHGPMIVRIVPRENKRKLNSTLQNNDNADHCTHNDTRTQYKQPVSRPGNSNSSARGALGRGRSSSRAGLGARTTRRSSSTGRRRSSCRLSIHHQLAIRIIQRNTYIRIQLGATVCRARARSGDNRVTTSLVLVVSQANREFVGPVCGRHIEAATSRIISVLAVVRGGDRIFTGF